jgi:putative FmdB family regulatory protein
MTEYLCDSCGSTFEVANDPENSQAPVECPVCHGHDTQAFPTLSSVYGYTPKDDSGCGSNSGFR